MARLVIGHPNSLRNMASATSRGTTKSQSAVEANWEDRAKERRPNATTPPK
eukprot:CAMPEP_0171849260 /NCGR_PEP_ID=MMETSP0992-20121227/19553_1 /TAXON_ID=483369 /ORGANISM="non described non described, Strain CCMP2098" /LENGTH=50 /DNA_ID=CAMNT_0012468401 /DNA_START=135 /DNA_END=284 /DNA_ORIENTATION=-